MVNNQIIENQKALAYTVPVVCKKLGISIAGGYRAVEKGEIPSRRVGNRILIPASWVDNFFSEVK